MTTLPMVELKLAIAAVRKSKNPYSAYKFAIKVSFGTYDRCIILLTQGVLASFPDHFLPRGKNWSGELPILFLSPATAKIVT